MIKKRIIFISLIILTICLLVINIPSNLSGAANPEELSAFEADEYAQYPYLLHMLTPAEGSSVLQMLHNFAEYGHYYYGYPFYFFSGLVVLPIKLALGADWTNSTALIIMMLRECISVLPMLLAILLLVWMQTGFNSFWKSTLTFLVLATFPAVVNNNVWWHPDSLLVLFCVLTIYFLKKDDLRFGRNFYFAAAACGLAVGTKVLGVLFFSTIIIYIAYGLIIKKLRFGQAWVRSGLFLAVMFVTIVVSNPLLLLPAERSAIIEVFKGNLAESTQGFWVAITTAEKWATINSVFFKGYGGWVMIGLSLAVCIRGLFKEQTRLLNLLLLVWSITYSSYFFFVASTVRSHYFLPALIPLFSVITEFLPGDSVQVLDVHPAHQVAASAKL
jgi:hypothetical protein